MSDNSPTTASFGRVVWPLAIAETIVWASMYYAFPALLPAWERDLGWSKTELSAAFTLSLIVSALLAPVAGRLIDRGHGRLIFFGGAVLGAVMLALLSQVTELWQFVCVWIGLGIAMSSTLYEACFAVLTRSLGGQAKRAITLVTLAAGFAGTLAFPSADAITAVAGWRTTVLVFAAALLLIAAPLIWQGCRALESYARDDPPRASGRTAESLSMLRRPTFWLIAFAFAMIGLDHAMIISHLLPLLEDRQVTGDAAVLAASLIGPMQVAGRLALLAGERYLSTLTVALGCCVMMSSAAAAALGIKILPGLIVAFVILQGAGIGVTSIIRPVVVAELLGRRDFGVASGMVAVFYMSSYALGPTVAALLWQLGGYDSVLIFAMLVSGSGILAIMAAWRLRRSADGGEDRN